MPSNPVAGIDIVARLDQFKRDLAAIPDIGGKEAKLLAAQMAKEIKAAERAASQAAKAAKDAKNDFKGLGDVAGKTGQSASKMAGALSLISPAAADAVRGLADFADVGEVAAEGGAALGVSSLAVAAALGVVTAAAAIGYFAWEAYEAGQERVRKANEQLTASLKTLQPVNDLAAASALDAAHAQGKVTDAEYAYQKSLEGAAAARNASIADVKKKLAADMALRDSHNKFINDNGVLTLEWERANDAVREGEAVIRAADRAYESTVDSLLIVKKSTEAKTAATEREKATTDAAAAAERAFSEDLSRTSKALGEQEKARKELSDIVKTSAELEMGALMDKIEADAKATEARAKAAQDAAAIVEQVADGERTAIENLYAEKERLLDDYMKAANAAGLSQQQVAEDTANIEIAFARQVSDERRKLAQDQLTSAGDLFGSLSALAMQSAESMSETNKEGAREAAKTAKALAVVQAVLNGIAAVSVAVASAPPPFNILPIAAATAQAAVQVGAAASTPIPSFSDTPRVIQMQAEDTGRPVASFAPGDHVAASRTREGLENQVLGGRERDRDRPHYTLAPSGEVFADTVRDAMRLQTEFRRAVRSDGTRPRGRRSVA